MNPTTQRINVMPVQHETCRFPVQRHETFVSRFQEHIGQVLPQGQGGWVSRKTLAENDLRSSEISGEYKVQPKLVSEGGHRVHHFVDNGGCQCPGEVTRGVRCERKTLREVKRLAPQNNSRFLRSLLRFIKEALKLGPIGGEVTQLVASSSGRCRKMLSTDGFASVDHVVAHRWLLYVGARFRERPDCCLDLVQGEKSSSVHCEICHDGTHRVARGCIDRRDRKRSKNVNSKCCRGIVWTRHRGHYGLRGWRWLLLEDLHRRLRRRCAPDDVDRHRTATSVCSPLREVDRSRHHSCQQGGEEIEHAAECLSRCWWRRGWRGCRHGQHLWELQRNSRWTSHHQIDLRDCLKTLVLLTGGSCRRNDQGSLAIRNRHDEVIVGRDQTVDDATIGVTSWDNGVQSRHGVTAARSRYVAKGRGGNWCHASEVIPPEWIPEISLNRTRTHLQGQEYLSSRCVKLRVEWVRRVECGRSYIQHARKRHSDVRVGDWNSETPRNFIRCTEPRVTGTGRRHPADRHDEATPQDEDRAVAQ